MITVVSPGARTTVQGLGRAGLGAQGVPRGGAMDSWALCAANLLVGNDVGEPGLEITLTGPTLAFTRDEVIAVVGARTTVESDLAVRVSAGDTIDLGKLTGGARAVVAVRGGLIAPRSLSSSPPLRAADKIGVRATDAVALLRRLRDGALRRSSTLRAVALESSSLFDASWTVTPDASRSGIRLSGPSIDGGEIEPEATTPGVVQVPPGGQPIVLGVDGPVTGGYRKVASVISADVGLLAYPLPGDEIAFEPVTVEQAREAWYACERALRNGIEDLT